MKVYLVGLSGHKTAFKITTAKVLTSIDIILDEELEDFIEDYYNYYQNPLTFKEYSNHLRTSYNIYYTELNGDYAKKLTGKALAETVEEYIFRNRDKVKEAERKRRIFLRTKGEE